MPTVLVHKYLEVPAEYPAKGICVIFGNDSFLIRQAENTLREKLLAGDDGEFSLVLFEGSKDLKFPEVYSAAASRSMFGDSSKLVIIDDADNFVSKNRPLLEDYAANPSTSSTMLLLLTTFPVNTKLHTIVAEKGLIITANSLSEKEMPGWVTKWAKQRYKLACDRAAAELMVQMVGAVHGLLDQELAKLSVLTKDKITLELVEQNSGSWSVKETFYIIDLALEGRTAESISELNKLLAGAGRQDSKVESFFGAFSGSLRRFATATQIILEAERNKKPMTVKTALERAGVPVFALGKAEQQLRKLTRFRGADLSDWLLQANLALRGVSRADKRFVIETLLIKISHPSLQRW
ncbi:MAG: DNA polymerase III subunit delta [Planctomycetaceae bacterium]|nr:DNA polymerase III subunit delta [Planctomycetaceae bacterium]